MRASVVPRKDPLVEEGTKIGGLFQESEEFVLGSRFFVLARGRFDGVCEILDGLHGREE